MDTKETINRLNSELNEIQFFIRNLDSSETLSRIDVDILLNKIRNLYEDIFKLKNQPLAEIPALDEVYYEEKPKSRENPYIIEPKVPIVEEKAKEKVVVEVEDTIIHELKSEEPLEQQVKPIESQVELIEQEIKPLEPEVEPFRPEIKPLEPEVEPLEPEPEIEPVEPEKPLVPIITAEIPKPEPEQPVIPELIAEVHIPEPIPQNTIVVTPPEGSATEKMEEKIHSEQVNINNSAAPEESKAFEEPMIEINEEFGGIQKRPEIKQTSLFGDVGDAKQTDLHKNKDRKESLSEKLQNNQMSVNDVLSTQIKDKNLASQAQHKPITNIRSVISINDRIWFVKELFDNNNDKYNKVVDKINEMVTYNEAIDYMSSVFNMTQEKESLNKFIEIVQRRFMGK